MKKILLGFIFAFCIISVEAQGQYRKQVRPTKNVIVMIPDGTSIGVVSAARWYNIYNNLGENLAIDPYICGTVKTFSSNAPIGDSAPTTSCYMTGVPQQTGNVAIYPMVDPKNDLVTLDPQMAFQPLTTILEAARLKKNKAVGLVVTCEFPQATPADCSAHYYDRGKYEYIASQMAYNHLDVVFGGGNSIVTNDMKERLKKTGTELIQNDLKSFRKFEGNGKLWALFGAIDMPYELDRDTTLTPSLAEMTSKAISRLSKDEDGFFLMVEGSKIDWAAHANDVAGCITEYLAFDKAVQVAIDFAKKNGETTVIVLPDHGNSGFSIGRRDIPSYDRATIHDLFSNVSKYKKTGVGISEVLSSAKPEDIKRVFKQYTGIELKDSDFNKLKDVFGKTEADYTKMGASSNMISEITRIMAENTFFGFTTGGHTGEEVFLAAYHPQGDIPLGMNLNTDMNKYLFDVVGLETPLLEMTKQIYAKHTDVFSTMKYTMDKSADFPVLKVKKGKKTLDIPAFKSVVYVNGKAVDLESVVVYIDKNDTFYLPSNLVKLLD